MRSPRSAILGNVPVKPFGDSAWECSLAIMHRNDLDLVWCPDQRPALVVRAAPDRVGARYLEACMRVKRHEHARDLDVVLVVLDKQCGRDVQNVTSDRPYSG